MDQHERTWLSTTANELNNLLQVIRESAEALRGACEGNPETARYYAFLRDSIERAGRVGFDIGAHAAGAFPRDPKPQPPVPAPVPAGQKIAVLNPEGKREMVLIIDDEPIITELAGEMLAGADYRVVSAQEPFRALEIYQELHSEIALVILDFTLPIMDGAEVFDELRKIQPGVAVMLSSGFTEQDKVRGMLAKGLRGFLPKPYTELKLLEQVRLVLDSLRSERTGERRVF